MELDSHSKDLRKTYLGIEADYNSRVDEISDFFIQKAESGFANALYHKRFNKILLLAIPNKESKDLMGLFSKNSKFIGDLNEANGCFSSSIKINIELLSSII